MEVSTFLKIRENVSLIIRNCVNKITIILKVLFVLVDFVSAVKEMIFLKHDENKMPSILFMYTILFKNKNKISNIQGGHN